MLISKSGGEPKKFRLAITGMEGVGKTVLFDSLTGKAFEPGYQKPSRSQRMETGKVPSASSKLLVSVVPGQVCAFEVTRLGSALLGEASRERSDPRREFGIRERPQHGCRSCPRQRPCNHNDSQVPATPEEAGTRRPPSNLPHHPYADFKYCAPQWLVVAVDKIDLYHDELADVERLYSPSAKTDFVKELNSLVRRLGTDFFRWMALPVVGYIEHFEWNGHIQRTQLQEQDRRDYVGQFLAELQSYCA